MPPAPVDVLKVIKEGNRRRHDSELIAYFCHFAFDSILWAYRYKKVK